MLEPDLATSKDQAATAEVATKGPTGVDPETGIPKDAAEATPVVTFGVNEDTREILEGITKDEERAGKVATAQMTLSKEYEGIAAFLRAAPPPMFAAGRLYAEVEIGNRLLSGKDISDDSEVVQGTKATTSYIAMAAECVTLVAGGTTTADIDPTDEASFAAAAIGQMLSGRASTGITAPGLTTRMDENAFRTRVEPMSGCLHHAAATLVLATAVGWLIHMTGDETAHPFSYWADRQTDCSVTGWRGPAVTASLGRSTVLDIMLASQEGSTRTYSKDTNGRLCVRTTYRQEALAHGISDERLETERNNRYLLAVPDAPLSVTAAAIAFTRGFPSYGGAGHTQLMAVMSESGVGYLTGVEGTQVTPPLDTPFGRDDVLSIMGYAIRSMLGDDKDLHAAAVRQVASVFRPSISSAHDWTDIFSATVPRLSRPYNEAAIDSIWDTSRTNKVHILTSDDQQAGERTMREFADAVTLNAVGVASAVGQVMIVGPTVLTAGNTELLQGDAFYNLHQYVYGAYESTASLLTTMSRMTAKMYPPVTALAALGLGCNGQAFAPAHCPLVITMTPKADGCYYIRDDGQCLDLISMDVNADNAEAVRGVLALGPGKVATARAGGNTITIDQECGGVIDCGNKTQRAMFPGHVLLEAKQGLPGAVANALIHQAMITTNTAIRTRPGPQDRLTRVVARACTDDAVGAAIRAALGVTVEEGEVDADQVKWEWHDSDDLFLDRVSHKRGHH